MKLLKLRVVIWKNFLIRKRHWLLTTFESLLPVAVFFLIAYARSEIKGFHKIEVDVPTYSEPVPITYDTLSGYTHLLFVPDNTFYSNIIYKTVVKFQLPSDVIKGFSSEENLIQHYYKNPNDTVLAIKFKGNNPKRLDYVIRYHDQYGGRGDFLNTGQLYHKKFFQYQQHRDIDYLWKGITALQKAIDISFIEESLGEEIDNRFSLYLKEFPYPPYKVDEAVTNVFMEYLPLLTLFSFIFICPAVLKRIVEEKQTGSKELLKMVGMESWMLWLGWFIYGMIPNLFSITLIVIFMKVPMFGSKYPPIEYTDGTVLFCYLLLYCMASNVFCFAVSSCFNNSSVVMVTGILLWILSYFVPKYSLGLDEFNKYPWFVNLLLNLFPNMALHYGYSIMSSYEERELGMQWSNIMKSSSGDSGDITMLHVFLMLLVDMVVYMLFTFYMDKINPGQYGVAESVFFPFKKLAECFSRKTSTSAVGAEKHLLELRRIEEGHDLKKCIELKNVSKCFGRHISVNNLDLDIYKNQITVLLGHNGAGKSTTMSMLTGMLGVTSGSIFVNGLDINKNMEQIRSNMGLCPQHNLLFSDLTVEEHLLLFAKLKGKSAKEASEEADELLRKLDISEKKHKMAHTLSGGMKRKLCLGMAVIGNSSVLILDEPSSGMDPESRRELWDLLLKWRNSKTILITTHFMEEADALGDWIAIMSDGHLNCYGTPLFLKKKYDTGYYLSLMIAKDTEENINEIKALVTGHIQDSKVKSQNGKNLVFLLPFESRQISTLLTKLEQNRSILGIENLSLTLTSLEDVFLRTSGNDLDGNSSIDSVELFNEDTSVSPCKKGYDRKKLQFTALIKKRLQFFKIKKFNYIFPFAVAVMFFCLTSYFSTSSENGYITNGPKLTLELGIYKKTTVYVNGSSDFEISKYKNTYKQLILDAGSLAFDVGNVENEILKKAMENIVYYKEHMITSAEFSKSNNEVEAFALYNSFALHSSPISLNLITNTIAKVLLGNEYSITISNWPLEAPKTEFLLVGYSETKISLLWLVMVPLGCLFILGSFIIFPHTEIRSNFVRLQYMCGVKQSVYWAINLLVDLLAYLLVMLVLSSILCIMSAPFRGIHEFWILYLIIFLYGISGIPCTYLFSRKKTASGAFALLVIMGMFLGVIMTLVIGLLMESGDEYYEQLARKLKILSFLFFPQVGLSYLLIAFARKAVKNYNMEALPKQMMSQCTYEPNPCCKSLTSSECSEFRGYIAELDMWWLMLVSFIIFFTLNCLLDSYSFKKIVSRILFKIELIIYKDLVKRKDYDDKMKIIDNDEIQQTQETLKAKQLFKSYFGNPVVKHISIELKQQECLGILGVNGAGKTTTFKMLTRDECIDGGTVDLIINNKKVDIGKTEYLESLGYCPQQDALNDFLTGREILSVVANLRGIDDPQTVEEFLTLCELTEYADIPCGYYSGGNKRKLSLAIALIGFPQFILLDEPTNGVDPLSRRKFWSLIKTIQKNKHLSLILTSHSMVECEALCNSLKIMKNGVFKKEGSISELKKEYGGFSVKLKLKRKDQNKDLDEVDSVSESATTIQGVKGVTTTKNYDMNVIKHNIKDCFKNKTEKCELKDEHQGLLHYYMKGKQLKWSNIFEDCENLKDSYSDIIEDYSISEASLEDVFMSVAKNKEDTGND